MPVHNGAILCNAIAKKTGEQCTNPAMRGQEKCRMHGASTKRARAAGERRQVEAEAQKLVTSLLHNPDAPPVTDPIAAMQRIAGQMEHAVEVLGLRVNELQAIEHQDKKGTAQINVLVVAYQQFLDMYRRTTTDMARLGIEERAVKVSEAQAQLMFSIMQRVFGQLELTESQQVAAGEIIAAEFASLSEGGGS